MIDKIFMVLLFVIMLAACESDEQLPFKTAKTRVSNTMGQVALRFKDSESLRSFRQLWS